MADLTTKEIGKAGRVKVAARSNLLTVGLSLLQVIDEGMEQAKRNIAQQAEKKKAMKAEQEAEQEAKRKAKEEAGRNVIHEVCKCCDVPLCSHRIASKAKRPDGKMKKQKENSWEPLPLQYDTRNLDDAHLYKKIGQVYYVWAEGRWRNVSLTNLQYQALISLHKASMHEMHDFFLAKDHPMASNALKRLSANYSMPARFWKHSIHSFLDVMRYRLPESRDFMITFILMACSMLQLLEETTHNWHEAPECLGDLTR